MTAEHSVHPVTIPRLTPTNDLHYRAVHRVIEMMVADTSKAFNIDDMSRVAYISPYHFIRVFHSVTGVAPCKFLWALKLHAAKELLFASTMPIVDISMEVGYNSLGTFTRRFTQLVGLRGSCARTESSSPVAPHDQWPCAGTDWLSRFCRGGMLSHRALPGKAPAVCMDR